MSIDSFDSETYTFIRKNADYERTMKNLKWFRDYCKQRNTYFGISACAMQQNWHQLADFVRKCNKLDSPVSLHTVFFPKHSSFQSLGVKELEKMISTLENEDLPANSDLERTNRHHFEEVIRQLKHLVKEKEKDTPELTTPQTVDGIKQLVLRFIESQQGWSDQTKTEKQEIVIANLHKLEQILGADKTCGTALRSMDLGSTFVMHRLLDEIEVLPTDRLLELLNGNQG